VASVVIRVRRSHLAAAILIFALAFRLAAGAVRRAAGPRVRTATAAAGVPRVAGSASVLPAASSGAHPTPAAATIGAAMANGAPAAAAAGGAAAARGSAHAAGGAAVARGPAYASNPAPAKPPALPATDADVASLLKQAIPQLPSTAAAPTAPQAPPPAALARNIASAASQTGLPADLIAAVIMAESEGDPTAVSPAGAQGLMQLEPPTASWLGVRDAFDPSQNVMAGASYLAALLRTYMTDHAACAARTIPSDSGTGPCPAPLLEALAAYNAGPHVVARYGGVPPYPETQRYIAQVLANFAAYSAR
jgi:soluble lytic murein transglycosylase-like protein